MKKILYTLILIVIVSCLPKSSHDYPYKKIDTKTEKIGSNTNKMELYTIPKTINVETLKMFCLEKKKTMTNGTFHFLIFFDSIDNATFPNNPMTALYGMEAEPQKHIRAYYEYNHFNGYSKLHIYETNSWESRATIINL